MGKFYEEIPENVMEWIVEQKVFWVSTAPLSKHGHVNVSPKKGGDCFGVPDTRTFWYMDMTGSGNETISHLLEPGNGRITILFNAFEGPPRILRLWGKGKVLEYGSPGYNKIVERENITTMPGTRSVIVVDIHQVGTSCGYQVPFFSFVDYRRVLEDHFKKKVERGLKAGKEFSIEPIQKMVGKMAPKNGNLANGELHVAYVVIALLTAFVAILAATHPAFEYFPAQRRMQGLISQVTSMPRGLPSAVGVL
ncbi:hypothetical protein EKO27_g6382 [Xylaria grammica]|uniref:Uncharacterized protein n=1 Tax=Xylaria grammica TaxID=363999 RepID=A0A439D2Q4_9PEZI|nr:hypothetical protein EKO27_g6382 [Xylaria grammica]